MGAEPRLAPVVLALAALLVSTYTPAAEIVRPDDLRATVPGATAVVVVYSRTGHSAKMARAFAKVLGADYQRIQGAGDEGDSWFSTPSWKAEVAVSPKALDLGPYPLVLFGGPIWYWRPDAVINSFARASELRGKRVVLFFTYEGGAMSPGTEATWRRWVTDRGGTVVDVVGINRKDFSSDEALVAESERIARERQPAWSGSH